MPGAAKRALDQRSLTDMLGCPRPRETVYSLPIDGPPEPRAPGQPVVVELFCGLGGWTEGCRRAGLTTVLAVDSNMPLLRIHKSNHPKCTQCQLVLGPNTEDLLVPLIRKHVGEGQPYAPSRLAPVSTHLKRVGDPEQQRRGRRHVARDVVSLARAAHGPRHVVHGGGATPAAHWRSGCCASCIPPWWTLSLRCA